MQGMRDPWIVAVRDVRNRIERKRQQQAGECYSQPAWWGSRESKHGVLNTEGKT